MKYKKWDTWFVSFISLDILLFSLLMMHTLLHMCPPLINKLNITYINSLMPLPFISITLILIVFLSFSYFSQLFYQVLNFKKSAKILFSFLAQISHFSLNQLCSYLKFNKKWTFSLFCPSKGGLTNLEV